MTDAEKIVREYSEFLNRLNQKLDWLDFWLYGCVFMTGVATGAVAHMIVRGF